MTHFSANCMGTPFSLDIKTYWAPFLHHFEMTLCILVLWCFKGSMKVQTGNLFLKYCEWNFPEQQYDVWRNVESPVHFENSCGDSESWLTIHYYPVCMDTNTSSVYTQSSSVNETESENGLDGPINFSSHSANQLSCVFIAALVNRLV